jgi:arylsulfatase A-like enzyme
LPQRAALAASKINKIVSVNLPKRWFRFLTFVTNPQFFHLDLQETNMQALGQNRWSLLGCWILLLVSWTESGLANDAGESEKPNVIIVITDDQGWGDIRSNGNSLIKTPSLDRLAQQSTILNNYHVDPTCAPTRSALLTGRYSDRVGVWHTISCRNLLRSRETTMADIFKSNGYATGMFGKWHLGDCYPFRPEDRGFDQVVFHAGGGVMQAPDYFGNDYFDDTYLENGTHKRFDGYCTDVWFEEGMKFIKANKDKPFFAYIATNAPHGPLYCPQKYVDMYKDNEAIPSNEFYGMITNIDDNMAKLMSMLEDEGLAKNTILVFTTDNGTAAGLRKGKGFDGNMRGKKGSQYDGGHRVPFMIRWPDGNITAGKQIDRITAHIDILPTFIEMCDLESTEIEFDGSSLRPLILGDASAEAAWPDRTIVVESQRVVTPEKWRKCAVMTDQWRLVDGKELYDIKKDPKQEQDVIDDHPEVVARLKGEYDVFWNSISADHNITSYMIVGADDSPIVKLSSHDWLNEKAAWYQPHIINGTNAIDAKWVIEVVHDGEYEISLRRWPVEADKGINDGTYGKAFNYKQARLRIADIDETVGIPNGAKEVTFRVKLKRGLTTLSPLFIGEDFQATPYYAYVTHQIKAGWQTPAGMGVPVFDPTFGSRPPQNPLTLEKAKTKPGSPVGKQPRSRSYAR